MADSNFRTAPSSKMVKQLGVWWSSVGVSILLSLEGLVQPRGNNAGVQEFLKEALCRSITPALFLHPCTSTFVETIDLPLIETLSERFLKAINYYGLVELEYKLDPRDGQYKLLDVNARTWGYHSLGPRAGVDFPYLLFADQLGEPVEICRAKAGVKWIRLVTDISTGVVEIFHGHLDWRAYLQSLRGVHVESVFSREDPLPALVELTLVPYLAVKRGF
jgi:predicted ATP-grasp superfamily ATP-dependent carboligase